MRTTKDNSTPNGATEAVSILTILQPIEDYKNDLFGWFAAFLADNEMSGVPEARADAFVTYDALIAFFNHLSLLEEGGRL